MKPFIAGLALLASAGLVQAQKEEPFDFKLPQSPPKPAPAWFKAAEQDGKDARLKGYRAPEGVKIEIVAEHPVVVNPVAMAFGDDGSLYVIEWRAGGEPKLVEETIIYKDGSKKPLAVYQKSVKDVVKRLRDTNGDGVYDEAKVIIEDDLPSGILVHDGWIYLAGRGNVRRYRQSQKDGPFDVKEVIAQGFGGIGHRQVSGLAIGNDGWLYITAGGETNHVEGSDGSRATVLRGGAIFRCRPDGARIQVYAIGFCNPYGPVAFDLGFQMFHADNDQSGEAAKFTGCRLIQVAEAADYGWRYAAGAREGQPDPALSAVWGELPGKMTPMLKTGRGGPAGLLIYEENCFPERFRGLIYYPDAVRQSVRGYQTRPMASSFEVTHEFELLRSDDALFRPCQMVAGPDGAIYVCDWRSDLSATAGLAGDGKAGRILKLSWAGTPDSPALPLRGLDSWANYGDKSVEELVKLMASEYRSDRLRAQRELVRRGGDEIRKQLLDILLNGDQDVLRRVAALGALNNRWNRDVKLACMSLVEGAGSPDLRRLAAEALALNAKPGDIEVHGSLLRALGDQNHAARRAIALAMGAVGHPDAADALTAAFKFNRDNDPYLADGYLRAIERLGKPGIDKLIDLALSGDKADFEKVINAFLALRTKEAAAGIPDLLKYPHLTEIQRARLLEAYRHILVDPPLSLSAVAEYLTAKPEESIAVKVAGLTTLAQGGQLKGERLENLAIGLLDEPDPEVRKAVIQLIAVGRVRRAAPKLAGMLADARFDWKPILQTLRTLDDKSVVPVVKETVLPAKPDTVPAPVRVEALRTLAALDAAAGQEAARSLLTEKSIDLVREAVVTLAATPAGARLAGESLLAKKLPAEVRPQVVEALKRHAGQNAEIAKLLAEVMK